MSYVWMFEEGSADEKDLLGGKGANLAEMTRMGLPVPPGFTITTDACRDYLETGELPDGLIAEIDTAVAHLEERVGRHFGDPSDPLLVSVRSGARYSMPGMMDTVLNIGLNSSTVKGFADAIADERAAFDAYRRLLEMHGKVVLGVPEESLREVKDPILREAGVDDPAGLDVEHVRALIDGYERGNPRGGRDTVPLLAGDAAALRDRGRLPLLERTASSRLPRARRDPRRPRDGGERPGHGLRQPRG
jgi:pyruvate, orthophosphate dikinase